MAPFPNADDGSVLSRLLLFWIHPILREGWKGTLDPDEMAPLIPAAMDCADVTRRAKAEWAAQEKDPKTASIGRAFTELCRAYMVPGVAVMVVQGLMSTVLRPISLGWLIRTIEAQRDGTTSAGEAVAATSLFAAVSFGDNWLKVIGYQRVNVDSAATFNAAATSLIFDKMMRVAQSGEGARTTDSIANLVGSDVIGVREMFMILGLLPWAVVGGIGGIIMTFVTLGPVSACVGLVVNFSLVYVSTKLSRQLKKVETERTSLSDKRIQKLTQLIEGIKAVKYYAWEEPSTDKISEIRAAECALIGKYRRAQAVAVQVGRASPPLAACAALVVYSYVHDEFSARNAFVTIAIFQALRPISIMLPTSFVYVMSLGNAFRRIQEFLSESDHPERQITSSDEDIVAELSMCDLQWRERESSDEDRDATVDNKPKEASSSQKRGLAQGKELEYDLRDVSVKVTRGTVTAVVGPVGSGKSTLLSAVVGELVPKSGSVRSASTIGYVQQKSFIISDTIKNNVLFGREWDETRFQEAVEASEFIADLSQFVDGIQTLVGERGATLSGGQQQRLSICRAIYGRPDLLVLDDPLSALDATVGEAIFTKAIRAYADDEARLRAPGVLMATNQLHILNRCDHIILLEGGAVRAQGSYAELQQDQGIAQYLQMRAEASVDEVAGEMSSSSDSVDDEKSAMERDARKGKEGKIDTDSRSTSSKNQTKQQAEKDKERQGETLATGRISSSVYLQYVRSLGWHSVVVWSIGLGFTYACTVGGDWWLTIWIDSANGACLNTQADEICSENDNIYRIIYIAFCLLFLAGAVATSILLVRMGTRSGKTLHHDVFTKVLAAPLSWHEENPSGRVTSRFSAELLRVDIYINQFVDANSGMIYQLIATLCVIMIAIPPIIPVVATSGVLYVLQCILVDRGQRDFKRATNSALAPVMSNLSETLAGRVTVKAMGCEPFFVSRHNARVNHFTRMDICSQSVLNFGNLAAGYVSFPVTTGCAIMAVGWGNSYDPEQLGLALSYCFLIPYFASFIAQMLNTLLMMFTALERLVELKLIPQEAARTTPADDALPLDWPAKGEIVFDHAVLFYRPELPPALKDLHVTIPGGAHCGIVGRTGAGKSSIMALLFRLCEVSSGSILIDGHPIASLGLRRLRTAINMIPQDPILLEGTVRANLDPFDQYTDEEVSAAIDKVMEGIGVNSNNRNNNTISDVNHDRDEAGENTSQSAAGVAISDCDARMERREHQHVRRITADMSVSKDGNNFSAGERQLLALARVFLYNRRIVVMDEPTASIDTGTDERIQPMIRQTFKEGKQTLLCIAHRLTTVIAMDRILVLANGSVVEYDKPNVLIEDQNGYLSAMVDALGPASSTQLREKCRLAASGTNDDAENGSLLVPLGVGQQP